MYVYVPHAALHVHVCSHYYYICPIDYRCPHATIYIRSYSANIHYYICPNAAAAADFSDRVILCLCVCVSVPVSVPVCLCVCWWYMHN